MKQRLILMFALILSSALVKPMGATSGGEWIAQDSGTTYTLNSVWFLDHNRGFVVGGDTLLKTLDGGNHWQKVDVNIKGTLKKVSFVNSKGWITVAGVGTYYMLHSNDWGETWERVVVPPDNQRSHIFVSENRGWISATGGFNRGVWRTDNGGDTWDWKGEGLANWIFSIYFYDQNTGFVVNDWRRMWRTNNGGDSWQEIGRWGYTNDNPQAFAFISPEEGFFANGGVIYHTADSGTSWQSCPDTLNSGAIHILNPSNIWAVGLNGVAYYSQDQGKVWQSIATGQENNLYSVFFPDAQHGWAVGYGGTILKYYRKSAVQNWTLYDSR